jgi:biotin carboxylase
MKKKIAILGASYLQLPLFLRAKEMGLETHCIAWSEGAVCKDYSDYFHPISILDKELVLEKCQEIGIDGITTIATDMAVPTICFVAEKLKLTSNSYRSALISTNKWKMRNAFKKANCSIPNFVIADYSELNIEGLNFPLIVKPIDRSGSRGITKVNSIDLLCEAIRYAIDESFSKKAIVEEYVEGNEVSVETISWNGIHTILAITDKTTTNAPHFVELEHHQPSQLPIHIQEIIKAETLKCLDALEINFGASHSEFKITSNNDVYVIEVGGRMGGDFIGSHLVELSIGYDFLKGVIDVALNKFQQPVFKSNNYAGVYFLSKETQHLVPYFKQNNYFDVQKDIHNLELKNLTNSNDRSGYLIYQANNKVSI